MDRAQKYPGLWAEFNKLKARRESILASQVPLREQQEVLRRQQEAIREQEMLVVDKIKADRPTLVDIDQQLAGIARAMGGQSLNS